MPTVNCGFENSPDELVLFGPTLEVQIGFDLSYQASSGEPPDLPMTPFPALVDTGAMASCIDSNLANILRLPIVNRQNVAGVHGAGAVNIHLAQIYVPALNFTVYGQFAGVHLTSGGQPHTALIGRDFLRYFTMIYDGRIGNVILSND